MEDIVSEDNLLPKIDKYIDLTFIFDEVKGLYYRKIIECGECKKLCVNALTIIIICFFFAI